MEGPGKEPSESIAQNLCMPSPKVRSLTGKLPAGEENTSLLHNQEN